MSFAEVGSDSLRPILLRSSTPAPNEKVLLYLEGMQRESMGLGSPTSTLMRNGLPSTRRSAFGDDDGASDLNSNVQDGRKTEMSINAHSAFHEPGPQDPPGPRYESFDSGPSFGNKGPLPDFGPSSGAPPWNTWEHSTVAGAARVPLPNSVTSPTTFNINIEPPSTPSGSKSRKSTSQASGAPSKSRKSAASVVESDSRDTVRGHHNTPSKAHTAHSAAPDEIPLSPRRSRAGSRSQVPPEYPPLPPSTLLSPSGRTSHLPLSPRSHRHAPSVSPSDSPSQAPLKAARMAERELREKEKMRSVVSGGPMSDVDGAASKRGGPLSAAGSPMSPSHHNRPFSPYRHAATQEPLLFTTTMQVQRQTSSQSNALSQLNVNTSQLDGGGGGSKLSHVSHHSHHSHQSHVSHQSHHSHHTHQSQSRARSPARVEEDGRATPTPSRPHSPSLSLNQAEEEMVAKALAECGAGNRTSYAPSTLEPEIIDSHFHDMDLCILLHQMDDNTTHEVVKKALRKALRQRVKKLGMKYDQDSMRQYRKSFHDHDPSVHLDAGFQPNTQEPPEWAKELMSGMIRVQERLETLSPQSLNAPMPPRSQQSYAESAASRDQYRGETEYSENMDQYGQTPRTQTVNINTQPTGTIPESMYQNETGIIVEEDDEIYGDHTELEQRFGATTITETRGGISEFLSGDRDDSPGQQFLEEELYKLRVKPGGSQSAITHKTWEVARDDQDEFEEGHGAFTESGLPEIPDSGNYTERRQPSPPLPPIPGQEISRREMMPSQNSQIRNPGHDYGELGPPPWQRIHQRLLNWAIIWPMSEIDGALNSTTRGQQVDEVALSIWSTQTYKRYVRSRMTDTPGGRVDRLFVPPNMADAISTAVFNGRHGDACGMLRDLWSPFGFEGAPRLIVVLAKHRSDAGHWVVHRFSLPDGALTTYDSYPERTLPDGRPLGWWFAIRVAWPGAIYANPDHLMQKMVRLHRPMQLNIDNSVAAAGIWRNVLMGSRAERSLDLERLRDLINTEVKNLRQRKQQGKLSISSPKANWEDV
ncbi:uncharacterized protein BJ212DRAFT_1481217 [Suillus subaureus]|uniref:Uncharacterized protein n=1 Tax=Suillus subaureus TaxID=48587 RepID=A0A9P7EBD5_9AGAM|nr:uncharacterized protein BJ212DRAFT_1481217 [Suillus subaureus]KAG1816141.1 hypothetical protein BJ212DRAFT_1481217 [Suillus subaureus]